MEDQGLSLGLSRGDWEPWSLKWLSPPDSFSWLDIEEQKEKGKEMIRIEKQKRLKRKVKRECKNEKEAKGEKEYLLNIAVIVRNTKGRKYQSQRRP